MDAAGVGDSPHTPPPPPPSIIALEFAERMAEFIRRGCTGGLSFFGPGLAADFCDNRRAGRASDLRSSSMHPIEPSMSTEKREQNGRDNDQKIGQDENGVDAAETQRGALETQQHVVEIEALQEHVRHANECWPDVGNDARQPVVWRGWRSEEAESKRDADHTHCNHDCKRTVDPEWCEACGYKRRHGAQELELGKAKQRKLDVHKKVAAVRRGRHADQREQEHGCCHVDATAQSENCNGQRQHATMASAMETTAVATTTATTTNTSSNDHPLFGALCDACRTGDLERVRTLTQADLVPVNTRDAWDSVPLFYAALCGHVAVVRFLLTEAGAVCDPHTFEGERCLYGALTQEIRSLLRAHRFSKAVDPGAEFGGFLHRLWAAPADAAADFSFRLRRPASVRDVDVAQAAGTAARDAVLGYPNATLDPDNADFVLVWVHRPVLAARSPYFAQQLAGRWFGRNTVQVSNKVVTLDILNAVLLFLYTGQMARSVQPDEWANWRFVASLWRVGALVHAIDRLIEAEGTMGGKGKGGKAVMTRDIKPVQTDLLALVDALLAAASLELGLPSGDAANSSSSNGSAATAAEPSHPADPASQDHSNLQQQPSASTDAESRRLSRHTLLAAAQPDILICVDTVVFPCHKAFLLRSEYFAVMMSGRFADLAASPSSQSTSPSATAHSKTPHAAPGPPRPPVTAAVTAWQDAWSSLPSLHLRSIESPPVFACVLEYLYKDDIASTVTPEIARDLLLAADLLLLDRLKTAVVLYITTTPAILPSPPSPPLLDPYDLMRTAWALNLPRLENHVSQYFARCLSTDMVDSPEFLDLVTESAQSIRARQETDTVVLIDDLRFWIGRTRVGSQNGRLRLENGAP
ncbi:hypothetical protein BC831DRAFT_505163 [Entophlyctis helioformis]|nr:hypothetical protein BC831DRAFT_505163 [Entophlyctis helioformis]